MEHGTTPMVSPRLNHVLLAAMLLTAVVALSVRIPWLVVSLTFCSVCLSNFVDLWPYVRHTLSRRVSRHLPYAVPLATMGFADHTGAASLGLAVLPAVVVHALRRRDLRLSLNRRLTMLMTPETMSDKLGEAAFFGLSGISQEYLHRYAILTVLAAAADSVTGGRTAWSTTVLCVLSGAIFVLEHLVSRRRGHTAKGPREVVTWLLLGAWFAWLVLTFDAVIAVMVGHVLVNSPAVIRPFLRPTKEKTPS